jgi:hypothetical protein
MRFKLGAIGTQVYLTNQDDRGTHCLLHLIAGLAALVISYASQDVN